MLNNRSRIGEREEANTSERREKNENENANEVSPNGLILV
jgi:hypothetical protein